MHFSVLNEGGCIFAGMGAQPGRHMDFYHSRGFKIWRAAVLRNAKYLCEECARYGRKTPAVVAHHVKHVDEFPELALDVRNGRALCEACHNKAHPEKGKGFDRY